MNDVKVVFVGPAGAGKTTAIQSVSDISVINTEVARSSLDTELLNNQITSKNTVTVGIDYGEFIIDDITRVRLYGVPGQVRFESLWDVVHEGSTGTVILFDISSRHYRDEFVFFINRFLTTLLTEKCIIGFSNYSEEYCYRMEAFNDLLNKNGIDVPVYLVDVNDRLDVLNIVIALFK